MDYKNFKSNSNVVYSCKYHVVWCPKYRRKLIEHAVEDRLKAIIQQASKEKRAEVIEMDIMPDHVHLHVEVDPQYGIHKLVKHIKGRSSHLLRSDLNSKCCEPVSRHSVQTATLCLPSAVRRLRS